MENKHRSGVLIGREPFKPAKVTVLSNEKVKIHSLGDEDTFGVIYPAVLDELDPLDDGEVETVINLDDYPLPKEGHIGYVKFENPNDYVRETEPRLFDVNEYEFEVVDEDTHPCAGVMYPAFLNDTPAEWRDLPPDGLTLEETESMVVLRTKCVITPGTMPIPKEGTVGYVKVESKHYEGPELKPRLFDVDDYEFGVIYPAVLDELDPLDDGEVETVNDGFRHDELMPTIGVYCTMACADYEPPRLLSASESEEILSKTKLVYADCN